VDHNSKIVLHCSNSYQLTQKSILFIQNKQLMKRMLLFYLLRFADFSRSFLFNIFFLNRIVSGVTSQYSSSSKNLIASSNVMSLVLRIIDVWSLLADRMLVKCFSRVIFTVRSFSRLCSPTIMPAYTSVPGSINIVPRSSKCKIPYAEAFPFS